MSEHTATKDRTCRCGHAKSRHTRAWGPNSIGQYGHGQCIAGWKVVHGYVFDHGGACKCERFRRRWLPHRIETAALADPAEEHP